MKNELFKVFLSPETMDIKTEKKYYEHLRDFFHVTKPCRLGERCYKFARMRDYHSFDFQDLIHVCIATHPSTI